MDRIIECFRKHPCLWDSTSEDFYCPASRTLAWKEVVQECNFPDIKAAKRRWKNLRDMHRQVLVRRNQSRGFHHKWKYEDQMEFLVPTVKTRLKENKTKRFQNKATKRNKDSIELRNNDNDGDKNVSIIQHDTNLPIQIKDIKTENIEEMNTEDDPLENTIEYPDEGVSKKESALYNFFMSMFETTSSLPDRLQLRVKRQIFNAVMEAQEEILS